MEFLYIKLGLKNMHRKPMLQDKNEQSPSLLANQYVHSFH